MKKKTTIITASNYAIVWVLSLIAFLFWCQWSWLDFTHFWDVKTFGEIADSWWWQRLLGHDFFVGGVEVDNNWNEQHGFWRWWVWFYYWTMESGWPYLLGLIIGFYPIHWLEKREDEEQNAV